MSESKKRAALTDEQAALAMKYRKYVDEIVVLVYFGISRSCLDRWQKPVGARDAKGRLVGGRGFPGSTLKEPGSRTKNKYLVAEILGWEAQQPANDNFPPCGEEPAFGPYQPTVNDNPICPTCGRPLA